MCAALAHVAVTGHHSHFASNHHIGRALDTVYQRLAAAVQVVKLRLGHGVVHVDGAEHQFALGAHLVQAVHARGGFFGHANNLGALAAVPSAVFGQLGFDGSVQASLFFRAWVFQQRRICFCALAQVHQERGVAAVVQNHVGAFAFSALGAEFKNAVGVIPVLSQVLAFHRKHGRASGGNGGRCVVLCRVNVARSPAHLRAQSLQGFNQHGGLNGHVQRTGHACTLQRLCGGKFIANGNQTGHFCLGNFDLFASPVGQADVGNCAIGVNCRV